MKVAFFINNEGIEDIDCSNIHEGNPGIGGSEYLIICLAALLNKDESFDVKLFCTHKAQFAQELKVQVAPNISTALKEAGSQGYNRFIVKHTSKICRNKILDIIPPHMDIIVWSHIFMSYWELDYYATIPTVKKIIFVSRESADLYRDHKCFNKIAYIYNCINLDGIKESVQNHPFNKRSHIVTYIGSLVPYKGFHILAQSWKKVVRAVPDAELFVIGGGNLYDNKVKLGPYELAEEKYEQLFMKSLTNESGVILPSVHLLGKMGQEKKDVLLRTKVGVPNPSGISETFCLSAVEMQAYGAVVTTMSSPGPRDTVINGVLYHSTRRLSKNIISLLKKENCDYDTSFDYFVNNFSYKQFIEKWTALIMSPEDFCQNDGLLHPLYRFKWLKECKRQLSKWFPSLYNLPIIERVLLHIERFFRGATTYLDTK